MGVDKVFSLGEAAARVSPGSMLGLGGMTLYRRPVAFVQALLRGSVADLTLLSLTCGFESDLLVGAGCVARVRTCYFGLEAFGLRATLAGVGFLPSRAWLGTDLPRVRPDVETVEAPYSGRAYTAFPALRPDVAAIHAPVADRAGNARLGGNLALDRELAMTTDCTVVTAEQMVEQFDGPVELPGIWVDHVVEAPRGAWPTSCYPAYAFDGDELLDYVESCAAGRFDAYLATFLQPGQVDFESGSLYNQSARERQGRTPR